MIERAKLLSDLQSLLRKLESDLQERSESRDVPEVGQTLRDEYQKAKSANRTAQSYEEWRSDYITQIAAAWILNCVFARFLEDNRLVDPPRIAGPGDRLTRARDEHELYFKAHPTQTDRDFLLHIFAELRKLPGGREIFGEHNPIHQLPNWLSGDAAGELLNFFQRIDPNTGALVHDFTDPNWDTRFLGDLYQDLSETARKKYALLQTPIFVEEFILDRTLDPAIDEFGLEGFRMIDPASGSGHFLLGSFHRILQRWLRKEPGTNVRVLVQRTLDSVRGVDVNQYAVAIARFRLILAGMKACVVTQLRDAPAFHLSVVCGDSLVHGAPAGDQASLGWHPLDHVYIVEDLNELRRILQTRVYHAVVANPPYVTARDHSLNEAYRERYSVCRGKYSLSVPFMQRIFSLAVEGGYTGQITANSFMNNEFGKTLVESFLSRVDLTHIIDTSGAHIPGHSTPTVILLGRNQKPVSEVVRTLMGISSEPAIPQDPAKGLVWTAIVNQVDQPESESIFITAKDLPRSFFVRHPWSLGGGGMAELRRFLETAHALTLSNFADTTIGVVTLEDDAYADSHEGWRRKGIRETELLPFIEGESVRDWRIQDFLYALFPYDKNTLAPRLSDLGKKLLWPLRSNLRKRLWFRATHDERGLNWFEYGQVSKASFRSSQTIIFAYKATHNHFVYAGIPALFKQTAPAITFQAKWTQEDCLTILGLLNCSLACFWERQVHRATGGYSHGKWQERLERNSTKVKDFPIPARREQCAVLATEIQRVAKRISAIPVLSRFRPPTPPSATLLALAENSHFYSESMRQVISLQEELDWQCYQVYGLITENLVYSDIPPAIQLGQRAFEILMARKMVDGELETTWFERHGSVPITVLPAEWPDNYKRLVEQRIRLIESDLNVGLVEQPEYKRRWNSEPWESQLERAVREWLLDRLESYFDFDGRMNDDGKATARFDFKLLSIAKLADAARQDAEFMQVGELYRDDSAFDVQKLVADLVADESVPLLPGLRYKESGIRKRAEWEHTWNLQRQEDAIDSRTQLPRDHADYLSEVDAKELKKRQLGDIPVPPKYTSGDFMSSTYWRLRGKLDVPKERWVSFPYCEGEDGQMAIAWAGYDHLQLAQAVSAYYVEIQERLGGRDDPRLEPLLACLIKLLPWLKQWHNAVDPQFNVPMGDYFEGFIQDEARQMGKTVEEIRSWKPPKKSTKSAKKKTRETKETESRLEV